ncbi:unnamed protein product [Hymenolepis diminuta]|uniref:Uncharacterized protein n=1 Tax=Hymenolepis diminuta TaxID=6216 RepID=A0A564YVF0_HYMDI|nr:unnamed protein product [Hymenolepis diminuta]
MFVRVYSATYLASVDKKERKNFAVNTYKNSILRTKEHQSQLKGVRKKKQCARIIGIIDSSQMKMGSETITINLQVIYQLPYPVDGCNIVRKWLFRIMSTIMKRKKIELRAAVDNSRAKKKSDSLDSLALTSVTSIL